MKELIHDSYRLLIIAILCLGAGVSVKAQVSHGGMPYPDLLPGNSKMLKSSSVSSAVPFIEMPPFDRDSLLREDSLEGNLKSARRFANKFFVSIDKNNSGITRHLPDGTSVWRVGIASKGAYSLNVLFSEFDIPDQAKVFIYSPDRSTILGSFTSQNRQKSGVLPVAPIDGDSIVIEYIEPANSDFHGKLKISEVNHDYLGLRIVMPAFRVSYECEKDVVCANSHQEQRRSVCLIIVDGDAYCSGTLINNTSEDGTPYVLTASHCLFADHANPPADESKAESSVFFFNYENPYCYSDVQVQGTLEQSVAGATVTGCNEQRDMLLLKLSEMPPIDFMPYYSGWNLTNEIPTPVYAMHHPAGDMKKISYEYDMPYTYSFYLQVFKMNSHWSIDNWEEGITEGGSSGSGLFDAEGRLIGALSGGNSVCSETGPDYFYKINQAWTGNLVDKMNLKPWLDPQGTEKLVMNGLNPYKYPCVRLSNIKEGESPSTAPSDNFAAGSNSYGYRSFAEKFSLNENAMLYGVYFIPYVGKYSQTYPVSLKIYEGEDVPETLLHEQALRILNSYYVKDSDKFSSSFLNNWSEKENYIRLDAPVTIHKNLFVVFELPVDDTDPFALICVNSRSSVEENTAYFLDNGEWKPFTQNPLLNKPSSLYVDAVLQNLQPSSVDEVKDENLHNATAYVDENGNLSLSFNQNTGNKDVFLYDYSGRLIYQGSSNGDHFTLPKKLGIYIVRIVYSDHTEVLKVAKE
ncbi:MAG: trypsin-like peptidase domain-containing protein [Paludibacteraceae bacterium]|nr:trypsin-like peptidase domain-containing protein [Paludibacteraceae bacterium]